MENQAKENGLMKEHEQTSPHPPIQAMNLCE